MTLPSSSLNVLTMWMYVVVFCSALAVDLIPIFAPPAWTVMVFLQIKFDLNIWGVLLAGVTGSTIGRYLFSLYIPKVSKKLIKRFKREDLEFLGRNMGRNFWRCWLFVFFYTLTPLSTTALFTAAGMAKVKPRQLVPPFFFGKFASDAVMILTGKYAAANAKGFLHGMLSWKTLLSLLVGVVVIGGVLFIDWRELLETKKLKFHFKIWK